MAYLTSGASYQTYQQVRVKQRRVLHLVGLVSANIKAALRELYLEQSWASQKIYNRSRLVILFFFNTSVIWKRLVWYKHVPHVSFIPHTACHLVHLRLVRFKWRPKPEAIAFNIWKELEAKVPSKHEKISNDRGLSYSVWLGTCMFRQYQPGTSPRIWCSAPEISEKRESINTGSSCAATRIGTPHSWTITNANLIPSCTTYFSQFSLTLPRTLFPRVTTKSQIQTNARPHCTRRSIIGSSLEPKAFGLLMALPVVYYRHLLVHDLPCADPSFRCWCPQTTFCRFVCPHLFCLCSLARLMREKYGLVRYHLLIQRRDSVLHSLWIYLSRLHHAAYNTPLLSYSACEELVFHCFDSACGGFWQWHSNVDGADKREGLERCLEIVYYCVSLTLMRWGLEEAVMLGSKTNSKLGLLSGQHWRMRLSWERRMRARSEMRVCGSWLCCGRIDKQVITPWSHGRGNPLCGRTQSRCWKIVSTA